MSENEYIEELLEDIKDLRNRINSAIDYIEENELYINEFDYDEGERYITDQPQRDDLLRILRGKKWH